MAEVMAVSKAARAQKRMQNEDDENLLEDVDSRFAGIMEVCSSEQFRVHQCVCISYMQADTGCRMCPRVCVP
jgi:hypothetical protein